MNFLPSTNHRTALDCRDAPTSDGVELQVSADLVWHAEGEQADLFPASRHPDIHRLACVALRDFIGACTLEVLVFEAPWQDQVLFRTLRSLARSWGLDVVSAHIVQLAESAAQRRMNEARFLAAIRRRRDAQRRGQPGLASAGLLLVASNTRPAPAGP